MSEARCSREGEREYMVVEQAGYVGERDIKSFSSREAAERHVEPYYTPDEPGHAACRGTAGSR